MKIRYFKRIKNGVLDGVARAESNSFAEQLINEGYTEISREKYRVLVSKDLLISYRCD